MGKTEAKVTQEVLNEAYLNVSQDTYQTIAQSCRNIGSAQNVLNVIGSNNVALTVNQENSLQNMCILKGALKHQPSSEAAIELFNKLAAEAEAKGGLLAADSTVDQNVRNIMTTEVSQDVYAEVLQECLNDTNTDNIINIIASKGVKADVNQVNKSFNECIFNWAAENDATSEATLKAKTDAEGKAIATGWQIAGSAGSSLSLVGICSLVAFILCICCIVMSSGGKKEQIIRYASSYNQ